MARLLPTFSLFAALSLVAAAQSVSAGPPPPVSPPAAEPAGNIPQPPTRPTLLSRIRGLFDIDLPQFDPPGVFRLRVNPHFGDLFHKRYLRVTTGVDWAATDNLEFRVDADAFGTHGFRRGPASFGIGQLHLGSKYLLPELFRPDYETSVGLNLDLPTGRPPADFTDGHNHYSPYIILQHHSQDNPRLTTFFGSSLDFVRPSSVGGNFGRNQPHEDSVALNAGAVYDVGQLKWTLQTSYQTTALIGRGHAEHFFTVRPSVLWFVPKRYTFKSKTQWIVGFGARAAWGPDGREFGTGMRVQADLTFGQAIQRIRGAFDYRH